MPVCIGAGVAIPLPRVVVTGAAEVGVCPKTAAVGASTWVPGEELGRGDVFAAVTAFHVIE